jgi:hypothetical protein
MERSALFASVLALPLVFFGSACSTPSASEEGRQKAFVHLSQEQEALLPTMGLELSLEDQSSTRREIVAQLGTPDETFEDGRILAYWWSFSLEEGRLVKATRGDFLVLMAELTGVSDDDTLLRHTFITRTLEW